MAAPLSVHEDVLRLAKLRVEGLGLGGLEGRVIEREIPAGSWLTGSPSGDFLVVSGFGQMRPAPEVADSCSFGMAYPLVLMAVYRTTDKWSADDRNAQQAVTQALLDAFIDNPLVLTYPGASCDGVLLVAGFTSQGIDEAFKEIMRTITFEVLVRQVMP